MLTILFPAPVEELSTQFGGDQAASVISLTLAAIAEQ
jgi:hypothetical protein